MRTSTAYLAGAGTVIAAIVGGVGGGFLIADMINPKSPKQGIEQTRLERRMSPEPIPAANAPSEPVQYLGVTQLSALNATAAAVPTPAQAPAQTKTEDEKSAAPAAQATDSAAASQPAAPASQPAAAAPATARERTSVPEGAVAKARDGDAKTRDGDVKTRDADVKTRDADVKERDARDADSKRAAEKRRPERRQQWVERRRYQQGQEQDLQAVEDKIRDETEPRREFATRPVRIERPLIPLFDPE